MWWWPGGALLWTWRSNLFEAAEGRATVYPKAYLQASFETFLSMLAISWIATCAGNYDVIKSNRIKDVFGYNNVCVGFDTAPARYFAQPLMCLQAFYGMRFVTLDSLRSEFQVIEGERRGKSFWFTNIINNLYVCTMLGWGMLLIVLPMGNSFAYHFYIYAVFVVVMYLTIMANFIEEDWNRITWCGWVWVVVYGLHSFMLLAVGTVGFNGYDYDKCPNDMVETYKSWGNNTYEDLCNQDPTVPIGFMATLDYGWFVMLVLTPYMLPESRPIIYEKIALADPEDPACKPSASKWNLCIPIGTEPACWTYIKNMTCELFTKCLALCGKENPCVGEDGPKQDERREERAADETVESNESAVRGPASNFEVESNNTQPQFDNSAQA